MGKTRRGGEEDAALRTYVDDLHLIKEGLPGRVATALARKVKRLHARLRKDGMLLEMPKCTALGSTAKHRAQLRAALARMGIVIKDTARDLGVDASPGKRRRVTIVRKRLKDGVRRLVRVACCRLLGFSG